MTDDQVIQSALHILEARMSVQGVGLNNHTDVANYMRLMLGPLKYEVIYIFYLDTQNRVLHHGEMSKGSISSSYLYPREVMRAVIEHNATALVLAHNHPGGTPEPSKADYEMTLNLMEALTYVGCDILDHIVVTAQSAYSMDENGTLPILKQ